MAGPPQLVQPPNSRIPVVNQTGAFTSAGSRFFQKITDALNGTSGVAAAGVSQVTLGTGQTLFYGPGDPTGVVSGNIGDQYTNSAGGAGTTLYVKETGAGTNTGWVGK